MAAQLPRSGRIAVPLFSSVVYPVFALVVGAGLALVPTGIVFAESAPPPSRCDAAFGVVPEGGLGECASSRPFVRCSLCSAASCACTPTTCSVRESTFGPEIATANVLTCEPVVACSKLDQEGCADKEKGAGCGDGRACLPVSCLLDDDDGGFKPLGVSPLACVPGTATTDPPEAADEGGCAIAQAHAGGAPRAAGVTSGLLLAGAFALRRRRRRDADETR